MKMHALTIICALLLLLGVASAFNVVGTKLYDSNGNPVLLRGVARPSFEWSATGEQASLSDYTLMKNWGANVVRLGTSQCFWLDPSKSSAYQATIDQQITWIKSLGMAVIIDLHWSNKGSSDWTSCGQNELGDSNSITYWTQVATKYRNDSKILFELYNEPFGVSWDIWLNGGSYNQWTVVGMQQLYNAVRATGAANVVVVGGLNYAYDLTGLPSHALTGYNIMYNTHPYDFGGKQAADWPTGFGFLANTYALIATEFGEFNCNPNYNQQFVNYANSLSMSWTAWGWYVGGCGFPSLITDWSGTAAATAVPVQCDLLHTQKIPGNTTWIGGPCSGSSGTTGSTTGTNSNSGGGIGTGVNVTIYYDSVNVYTDDTWATTKVPQDSTFKHSGSYSYSWTPSNYNAMYFYSAGAVSTTAYKGLEFWVHGGTTGNQNIKFNIVQGSPSANKIGPDLSITSYIGVNAIPTYWIRGFVDFSAFPAGNYDGVWFQSSSSGTDGTVYFDDVILVANPPATTSTGGSATTATSSHAATSTSSSSAGLSTTTTTTSSTASKASTTTTTTSTSANSASSTTSAKAATTTTTSSTSNAASTSSTTAKSSTSSTSSNPGSSTTSTSSNPAPSSTSSSAAQSSASTATSSAPAQSSSSGSATSAKAATTSSSTSAGPAATTSSPAGSSSTASSSKSASTSSGASSAASSSTQASAAPTSSSGTTQNGAASGTSAASSGSSTHSAASSGATSATATSPTTGSSSLNCTIALDGCPCGDTITCDKSLFCVSGICQTDSAIVDSHASSIKHSLLFVMVGVVAVLLM